MATYLLGSLSSYYVRVCTLKNARNWKPCTAAAECSTVIDCTITKRRTFCIHAYHRVQQRIAAAVHGLVHTIIITVLDLSYIQYRVYVTALADAYFMVHFRFQLLDSVLYCIHYIVTCTFHM